MGIGLFYRNLMKSDLYFVTTAQEYLHTYERRRCTGQVTAARFCGLTVH